MKQFRVYQINFQDAPVALLSWITLLSRENKENYAVVTAYIFDKIFKKTAFLETDDKEEVFHICQNIDDNWLNNPILTPYVSEWASLSVGDLVIENDKIYWIIMPYGWFDASEFFNRWR